MKIPHILCVAYHGLNGMCHYFIMKALKVLNRFFHIYAINVTVTTCAIIFLAYFTMLSPHTTFIKNSLKGNCLEGVCSGCISESFG